MNLTNNPLNFFMYSFFSVKHHSNSPKQYSTSKVVQWEERSFATFMSWKATTEQHLWMISIYLCYSQRAVKVRKNFSYENVPGEIWDTVLHWTSLDGKKFWLTFILGFLTNHINSFKKKSIQGLLWKSQIKILAPHASCEQKKNILDNE